MEQINFVENELNKRGDFPKTESQSKKIITLPIHQDLKRSDIIRICKLVNKFVGN